MLKNYTMSGVGIALYENVWSNPTQSIAEIESLVNDENSGVKFTRSVLIGDKDNKDNLKSQYRTSQDISTSKNKNNKVIKDFEDKCEIVVNECLSSYKKEMMIGYDIYNPEGFNILKYEVGGRFGSHYDSYPGINRCISGLIYLNDDYEGGEIEFVYFNLKIKPKAGTVILFPSNYPYRHIAHPVTSGTKYSVATWYHER